MAADGITSPPAPPRLSASSPPTVGTLLTRASAARDRGCSSPRSLLSRILHRGRGGRGRGAGFGCRLCILPRYCASASAAAANEDAVAAAPTAEAVKEEEDEPAEVAAPTAVVAAQPAPREPGSPRSSLGKDTLPASLGLGAGLVLLLSKSAAELSRMAELRSQMERLLLDARADVRSCNGRPSASGERTDCASVVKAPVARAGDDGSRAGPAAPASRGASEDGGHHDMSRMEAELEAELSRLQLQGATDDEDSPRRRRRDDHQLEAMQAGPKSSASSRSHSTICSDSDDDEGETDNGGGGGGSDENQDRGDDEEEDEDNDDDDDERDADEGNGIKSPPHGGVSARELERRLHQLLQSRHEARIAELESALERARQKLRETEREACRWRDTAKLATRFAEESRLR